MGALGVAATAVNRQPDKFAVDGIVVVLAGDDAAEPVSAKAQLPKPTLI